MPGWSGCYAQQCRSQRSSDKKRLMPGVMQRALRDVVDWHGLSERRACRLADHDRSSFKCREQDQGDNVLHTRLRELANECHRFGYRHLGILLTREGFEMNRKTLFRIYRHDNASV